MARFTSMFGLVLVAVCLTGCGVAKQGRAWRLYDTRTEYQTTKVGVNIERSSEGRGLELQPRDGCIEVHLRAWAQDFSYVWYVYECEDWKLSRTGQRTASTFLITDPPGQEYAGAVDDASPEEIPPAIRKAVGVQPQELSLNSHPVLVEWQVATGIGRDWASDAVDPSIVIKGEFEIANDSDRRQKIVLCDEELRLLRSVPSDEFMIRFRVSPMPVAGSAWEGSPRKPLAQSFFLRERLTRPMIKELLDQVPPTPAS